MSSSLRARLVVEHQLDLIAQREGVVVRLMADTGKRLEAGDLLVQLDDRQNHSDLEATRAKTRSIEAELKSREAGQKVLQADYERAKKMWDADLLPREQLEHAQFKMESEEWEIRRAGELLTNSKQTERGLELELEKMQIRAPFRGIVARRTFARDNPSSKGIGYFGSRPMSRCDFASPSRKSSATGSNSDAGLRWSLPTFLTNPISRGLLKSVRWSILRVAPSRRWWSFGSAGESSDRNDGQSPHREDEMNLARALDVALPEIPARTLAQRYPRIEPGITFREHVEDGQVVVRLYVPSKQGMYKFSRELWKLVQLFDGKRSYEQIAELYSQQVTPIRVEEVREIASNLEAGDFWYTTPQEKNILLLQQTQEARKKKIKRQDGFADLSVIVFSSIQSRQFRDLAL